MKATKLFNGSKAIVAFLIFTILAICSCKKEPDPVKPRDLVKPISTVNVASKVTTVSATISGTVEPGEIGTKIYVEFCESNMAWQSVYFFTTVDTKTVNVSFDLLNLKPQTVYNYRITAQNAATTQL